MCSGLGSARNISTSRMGNLGVKWDYDGVGGDCCFARYGPRARRSGSIKVLRRWGPNDEWKEIIWAELGVQRLLICLESPVAGQRCRYRPEGMGWIRLLAGWVAGINCAWQGDRKVTQVHPWGI